MDKEIIVRANKAIAKRVGEITLIHDAMVKIKENVNKKDKAILSLGYLTGRLASLQRNKERAEHLHADITTAVDPAVLPYTDYIQDQLWTLISEEYVSIETLILDRQNELQLARENEIHESMIAGASQSRLTSTIGDFSIRTPTSSPSNLPKIPLPTFAGDRSSWKSFRDLFESIIDKNQDIAKIQKFHYLKGHLKGEAANVVAGLKLEEGSYDSAWATLVKRYENKRLLITSYLNKLFSVSDVNSDRKKFV